MTQPTRGPGGVRDSALNRPLKFAVIIEGGVEAPDQETARAFCLSNVSFTAGFGQMVSQIRVAIQEQEPELFDHNGIKIIPN